MAIGLTATSCSLFAPTRTVREEVRSTLPADRTAALLAQICRDHWPGADPLPMHALAPIVRKTGEHFRIRYTSIEGRGPRVWMNGRIGCDADGVRFEPAAHNTIDRAWSVDATEVEVTGSAAGCLVTLRFAGDPQTRLPFDRIVANLRAAEALEMCRRLLHTGAGQSADALAARTLEHAPPGVHAGVVARLHHLRAVLALSRHDLGRARQALRLATTADPRLQVATRLLATTERRLSTAAGPEERLRVGDLAGAELRAIREATRTAPDAARRAALARLRARIHAARGASRHALHAELVALSEQEFDADLVLSLADRYDTAGDTTGAVRLLLRFRTELEAAAPRRAARSMAMLCAGLPSETLARMQQSMRQADGSVSGPLSRRSLFARLSTLRAQHDATPVTVPAAPGR